MELQNSFTNYEQVAQSIHGYLKKSARNFYNIGVKLMEVKEFASTDTKQQEIVENEYKALIEMLPFDEKTANKFIQIAKDPFIKKYLDIVPSAYTTMYDLIGYNQGCWDYLQENGMNSFSTLKQVKEMVSAYNLSTEDKSSEDDNSCPTFGTVDDDESEDDFDDDTPVEAPTTASEKTDVPSEIETSEEGATPDEDGDIIITSNDGDIVITTEGGDSSDDDDETLQYFKSLAGDEFDITKEYSLVGLSIDPDKVKGNTELVAKLKEFMELATELATNDGVNADVDEDVFYTVSTDEDLAA